jgi:hypothetical protein
MRASRSVGRRALGVGFLALGIGIAACNEGVTGRVDQLDATASSDGDDATASESSPESGTLSDGPGGAAPDSAALPDALTFVDGGSDAQPILDARSDVTLMVAEAGPDAQPVTEAGADAQPVTEAGSDAQPVTEAGPDAQLVDAGKDDAPADASEGNDSGSDGAAAQTYGIIAALRGSACLACASDPVNSGCVGDGIDCESLAGTATAGPASGESRAQLCRDTLTCVLQSGCMVVAGDATDPGNGYACYCGDVSFATCATSPAQGACRSSEESGLESTSPNTVITRYSDTSYGAGMANSIALCMAQVCQASCFP